MNNNNNYYYCNKFHTFHMVCICKGDQEVYQNFLPRQDKPNENRQIVIRILMPLYMLIPFRKMSPLWLVFQMWYQENLRGVLKDPENLQKYHWYSFGNTTFFWSKFSMWKAEFFYYFLLVLELLSRAIQSFDSLYLTRLIEILYGVCYKKLSLLFGLIESEIEDWN
mgnify:CR=1 FL=1